MKCGYSSLALTSQLAATSQVGASHETVELQCRKLIVVVATPQETCRTDFVSCRELMRAHKHHAGLVFVLRSEDGSAWWRDGGGNFNVPIPRDSSSEEGAAQATLSSRAACFPSETSFHVSAPGSRLLPI